MQVFYTKTCVLFDFHILFCRILLHFLKFHIRAQGYHRVHNIQARLLKDTTVSLKFSAYNWQEEYNFSTSYISVFQI